MSIRKLGFFLTWVMLVQGAALRAAAVENQPANPPQVRRLSLREAIELALRSDPSIKAAIASRDRGSLAVLRAQLDRFSLRIDGFLTEQYQVSNLGGATPPATCVGFLQPTAGPFYSEVPLSTADGNTPTQSQCNALMGQYIQPDRITQGAEGQFNVAANLTVPLFTGFRITSTVNHARHMRDASAATVRDTERNVALAVVRSYWALRSIELRQKISEEAIARIAESVEVVANRVRAGLASPTDINRMETRRQSEQATLADLQGSASEGRVQLAVALGLGGTPLELSEPAEVRPPPPERSEDLDSFLNIAMHDRADLRAARLTTLAAGDNVRMQLANYYPQLQMTGLLQFSNNPYNPLVGARVANTAPNPFVNISGSSFIGGTVSFNIFDTLNTWTSVRDARLERARLADEERRIGRAVESDVRMLHARLLHHYKMREPLLRTRDIARDNLEIIKQRYKRGDVTLLDYIDAQVELIHSEVGLSNAATTIEQTWGELALAMGRLPR